jgi:hypothetical protein
MPLVLRLVKGSRVTKAEGDANLTGLADGSNWDTGGVKVPGVAYASLPAAAAGNAGKILRVTDIGPSGAGSLWISTGSRWVPLNGSVGLARAARQTGIGTGETLAMQALVPVGVLKVDDVLRLFFSLTKSGTTDQCTHRLRIGTAGTTADTQIWTGNILAAANQSGGFISEVSIISATSVQRMGQGALTTGSYSIASNTAAPAAVAISSADSNPLYVSLFLLSTGATNTVAITSGQIQLITP